MRRGSRWRAPQDPQGLRRRSKFSAAAERTQHGIEHQVEILADVLCQKAKDEVVVLLEELVLAPIPAVRHGVCEVLRAIQFDRDARIGAEQVDLELALAIKRNLERDIETESAFGFGECLEPSEEKRLRRAPGSVGTVGVLGEPASGVHEQARERCIDPVLHQAADAA